MTAAEPAVRDQWYCLGALGEIPPGTSRTGLLGETLDLYRDGEAVAVRNGPAEVATCVRYGCLWANPGTPGEPVPDIPEAGEADRRLVLCGGVTVRTSGPRVIENFLDMAHFPFVHTGVLGAEPDTEVLPFACEIRREVNEVWATDCRFVQPKAALSAEGAIDTRYIYRVVAPLAAVLLKTCPNAEDRWDVIALFVQPVTPEISRAHPVMFLIDEASDQTDLIAFQQLIFLQDRIIIENQRPKLLPLEPRSEIPTRADATSVAYRRWLKECGYTYGTSLGAAEAG
ncbi:MAG: aromatic ring-hydroxylating dioxygenase subunit alpha [Paracoccaceae bacterium]|nr:aromatic ring-hydroxylating dioxygenase subunit alpha [Paracoccaceae bacterium]